MPLAYDLTDVARRETDEEDCVRPPFTVLFEPVIRMDDQQFFQFCGLNTELRIERNADGSIVLRSLKGLSNSAGCTELTWRLAEWAKRDDTGRAISCSAGFILSNKAVRSPDVSWISKPRLRELRKEEWGSFAPICPDFVLELRSPTDSMRVLKNKMAEYIMCGARLGWLIDPTKRSVFVYRPDAPPEELHNPQELSGDPVLPDFVLRPSDVWKAVALDE